MIAKLAISENRRVLNDMRGGGQCGVTQKIPFLTLGRRKLTSEPYPEVEVFRHPKIDPKAPGAGFLLKSRREARKRMLEVALASHRLRAGKG